MIKQLANFDLGIKGAYWIITGEGSLDEQTKSGKTIQGILNSVGEDTQIAAFCGKVALPKEEYRKLGIHYASDVMGKAQNLDDAMKNTFQYMVGLAEDFAKKINLE